MHKQFRNCASPMLVEQRRSTLRWSFYFWFACTIWQHLPANVRPRVATPIQSVPRTTVLRIRTVMTVVSSASRIGMAASKLTGMAASKQTLPRGDPSVRDLKKGVQNKFRWSWLEESVTVDGLDLHLHQCYEKLVTAGKVILIL